MTDVPRPSALTSTASTWAPPVRTGAPRGGPARPSAWRTLRRRLRPPVTITEPPRDIVVERDVAVPMRDGVQLRVNVFRPASEGRYPVLLCVHPYGKDQLPRRRRRGPGYRWPLQYHAMVQTTPFSHSAWTGWEAPDPAHWTALGYVVVDADQRGWGHSEGDPTLLSDQEGLDGHDLVEWAAAQPWSTGRVGMSGVSYLAISQWATAAARPPHLAAICPWEGFTDTYREFARSGGLRNNGFFRVWGTVLHLKRPTALNLLREQKRRPLRDAWWAERDRDVEAITTPSLVCASFSDHDLHTRGSFEGFRRISSEHRWLYTHRGPKWATYYSAEGAAAQEQFFGHFLRGADTGVLDHPRVRVEVRDDADTVTAVRGADDWPPPEIVWTDLHLGAGTTPGNGSLTQEEARTPGSVAIDARRGCASFVHRFARDTEIVGPAALRLALERPGGGDISVFATVRKFRDGREVTFEGSYGFRGDAVTHGMLAASHRAIDPERSRPGRPVHTHAEDRPLRPGEIVVLDVELLPSATLFRAGDELRLDVSGRWPFARNPLTGTFPANHRGVGRGQVVLHTGTQQTAVLTIPVLPSTSARAG